MEEVAGGHRAVCRSDPLSVDTDPLVEELWREVGPIRPDDGMELRVQCEGSKHARITEGLKDFSFKL